MPALDDKQPQTEQRDNAILKDLRNTFAEVRKDQAPFRDQVQADGGKMQSQDEDLQTRRSTIEQIAEDMPIMRPAKKWIIRHTGPHRQFIRLFPLIPPISNGIGMHLETTLEN